MISGKLAPVREGSSKQRSLRDEATTFKVGKRGVVRRDHSIFGAHLDRKITDRQSLLDIQRADRGASVFNGLPGGGCRAQAANGRQDQVFGGDPLARLTLEADAHLSGFALAQGLGRQRVGAF